MNHKKILSVLFVLLMLFSIYPVSAVIPTTDKETIYVGQSYTISYLNETDPTNITAYYLTVTTSKSNESENITLVQGTGGNYSALITTTRERTATQGNTIVGIDYGDTITHTLEVNATETINVAVYTQLGRLGVLIYDIGDLFRSPILRLVVVMAIILIILGLLMFIVRIFNKISEQIGKELK